MRIILHLTNGSDGTGALLAANRLIVDGFESCIYTFGAHDGAFMARRNKASVTVWEDRSTDAALHGRGE